MNKFLIAIGISEGRAFLFQYIVGASFVFGNREGIDNFSVHHIVFYRDLGRWIRGTAVQDAFWKNGVNRRKGGLIGMIMKYKNGIRWVDN